MQLNINQCNKHISCMIRTLKYNNVKYPKLKRTRISIISQKSNGHANDDGDRGRKEIKEEVNRMKLESMSSVVTDDNVPEGHEGLHQFLYSKDGEEEHSSTSAYTFRKGNYI